MGTGMAPGGTGFDDPGGGGKKPRAVLPQTDPGKFAGKFFSLNIILYIEPALQGPARRSAPATPGTDSRQLRLERQFRLERDGRRAVDFLPVRRRVRS
ncbi:hypothetical protein ThrDRAFT_01444 [Frankia casuarinae]|nr:hypothetical protein ThrDRAFT_01444 [Frankia casuarinae]KEZ36101.1 hypothetical protein CEDDRAFT_02573 [Frankia sp. CeD]